MPTIGQLDTITTIEVLGEEAYVKSIVPSRVPGKDVLDVWVDFNGTLGETNMLGGYFHVDKKYSEDKDKFLKVIKEEIEKKYEKKLKEDQEERKREKMDNERRKRLQKKADEIKEMLSEG
jgi:hypothetical protein